MDEYNYQLAWACYRRGQIDQAIDKLKALLSVHPDVADFHGLLALCLLAKKRLYAANHEVSEALRLDAGNPMYHWVLAQVLMLKNQPKAAHEACDRSLQLNPEFTDAMLFKAQLCLSADQPDQARQWLDEAARVSPESVTVKIAYGTLHLQVGDLGAAERLAREAMQADPQDEDCAVLLGRILLRQGKTKEAFYLARSAIMRNPESTDALRLFTDIKARENWFLGLWWRFNAWISGMGTTRISVVLISLFLFFNLLSLVLLDMGHESLSGTVQSGWVLFVIYTWVGIPMYHRKLSQELQQFRFNDDF